jgi:hypothetical protein
VSLSLLFLSAIGPCLLTWACIWEECDKRLWLIVALQVPAAAYLQYSCQPSGAPTMLRFPMYFVNAPRLLRCLYGLGVLITVCTAVFNPFMNTNMVYCFVGCCAAITTVPWSP